MSSLNAAREAAILQFSWAILFAVKLLLLGDVAEDPAEMVGRRAIDRAVPQVFDVAAPWNERGAGLSL